MPSSPFKCDKKRVFGTDLSKGIAHEYSGNDYGACHYIVLEKKLFKNLHCWKIDKCEHEQSDQIECN